MGGGGVDHAKESIACDQCGGQTENTEANSSVAKAASLFGETEKASDARCERPAISGQGESGCCPPLFHQSESTSVFGTDPLAEPPNCRMIKKKRFGGDLEEI